MTADARRGAARVGPSLPRWRALLLVVCVSFCRSDSTVVPSTGLASINTNNPLPTEFSLPIAGCCYCNPGYNISAKALSQELPILQAGRQAPNACVLACLLACLLPRRSLFPLFAHAPTRLLGMNISSTSYRVYAVRSRVDLELALPCAFFLLPSAAAGRSGGGAPGLLQDSYALVRPVSGPLPSIH